MDRKGFTAIMDAGFFIILIGIAVILLSQSGSANDKNEIQDISESCDIIFGSKVSSEDFGFAGDDRVISLSDLVSASLLLDDGKAETYLKQILNDLYPWQNAYGLEIMYEGHSLLINSNGNGEQCVKRTYTVEFGGTLGVVLKINM